MRRTSKTMFISRIIIILGFMAYGVISCNQKEQKLTVKNIAPGEKEVTFKADREFLLLPIQSDAPLKKIKFYSDNNAISETELRLAINKLDYMYPVDLNRLKRDSDVRLIVSDSLQTSMWVDSIALSNKLNLDYADKYRPVYHFSAPFGWFSKNMGSFVIDGVYHMFYQYYTHGKVWGEPSIAHASGSNLFEWSYKKADFDIKDISQVNSGCVVIDSNDKSGYGNNSILYFYTMDNVKNSVFLNYSNNLGEKFKKTDVKISVEGMENTALCDPKIIRYDKGGKWVMLLSSGSSVVLLSSSDLKEWKKESVLDFGSKLPDIVIQNPELVELATDKGEKKWVLFYNIKNSADKAGNTKYVVGNFDGVTFTADVSQALPVDYGMDFATPAIITNTQSSENYLISWMDNALYANLTPNVIYTNYKTFPRKLSLIKKANEFYLNTAPSTQFNEIAKFTKSLDNVTVDKDFSTKEILEDMQGCCKISFTVTSDLPSATIVLSNNLREFVSLNLNFANKIFSIDRSNSGLVKFSSDFPGSSVAPLYITPSTQKKEPTPDMSKYKVDIYLDRTSVEVFINNGEIAMTNLIFPTSPYENVSFSRIGGNTTISDFVIQGFEYNATVISLGWMDWVEGTAGD